MFMVLLDQLAHFDKEINANVYHHSLSGSILNVSTVHLNGIWHLIWRYLSKPVLGGHPVLSGHHSIPRGCPLNTGFIVSKNDDLQGHYNLFIFVDPVGAVNHHFWWPEYIIRIKKFLPLKAIYARSRRNANFNRIKKPHFVRNLFRGLNWQTIV